MTFGVSDKNLANKLSRHLEQAREQRADSMEKLASGQVFTVRDPRPAERALSEKMEYRLRGLAASRSNVNTAVSLLQTAEGGLSEINNIILRMKELNIAGSNATVNDQERRYLFIEYQALHDELNRIAVTTEFNGMPLLNGESDRVPEELIFRIDDPFTDSDEAPDDADEDINTIVFEGFKSVVATAAGLGIGSAAPMLMGSSEDGIGIDDVLGLMESSDDSFSTVYDEALTRLSTQRAVFGAMQSRLQRSIDFMEVYQENIAAAKSNIADTDYAREVVKMAESNILMQATSGLLAQSNFDSGVTLNLLASVLK
jgi:flagellin